MQAPDHPDSPISVIDGDGNGSTVVFLRGEHDLSGRVALTRVLDEQEGDLVVDLCECEFIDSTIIGVLLAQDRRRKVAGERFEVVAEVDGAVARVLEIVNAHAVLTLTRRDGADAPGSAESQGR